MLAKSAPGSAHSFIFVSVGSSPEPLLRMHYRIRVVDLDDSVLSGVPPDATVVLVSNHRSNFDPLVITYLASQRSTIALSAGEWARLWPLHHLVRAAGGFVVDRDADDELYKRVLAAYIRVSARSGLHQAVFPEGELSRDGRMSQPKLGFLNYICKACCPERDIVFIPVGINYDRIPEDRRLAYAEGSFENPKASFLILSSLRYIATVLALPFRRGSHRYGLAGVCFDAPLSLSSWLDSRGVDIADLDTAGRNEWLPELAKDLMRRCARRIPVPPVPLAAAAIAGQPQQPSWDEALLCDAMKELEARLAANGAFVYLPDGMPAACRFALEMLQHNGLLEAQGNVAFRVNESERTVLQHYANSIEHLLT